MSTVNEMLMMTVSNINDGNVNCSWLKCHLWIMEMLNVNDEILIVICKLYKIYIYIEILVDSGNADSVYLWKHYEIIYL